MISSGKLVFGFLFLVSILANITLWYKHAQDNAKMEMIESAISLQSLSEESERGLAQDKRALEEQFKNNHYNIQNYGKDEPLVDVKALCDQPNGINCVYFKNGTQFYYGVHD